MNESASAVRTYGSRLSPSKRARRAGDLLEIGAGNDLPDPAGVYIHEVAPGGPAAGVLQGSTGTANDAPTGGDVFVTLAGSAIELRPGEKVDATIRRDGEERTVALPVGTRPQ